MSRTYKDRDKRNEKNIFTPRVYMHEDAREEIEEGILEYEERNKLWPKQDKYRDAVQNG